MMAYLMVTLAWVGLLVVTAVVQGVFIFMGMELPALEITLLLWRVFFMGVFASEVFFMIGCLTSMSGMLSPFHSFILPISHHFTPFPTTKIHVYSIIMAMGRIIAISNRENCDIDETLTHFLFVKMHSSRLLATKPCTRRTSLQSRRCRGCFARAPRTCAKTLRKTPTCLGICSRSKKSDCRWKS